jgi:hypothetical protein
VKTMGYEASGERSENFQRRVVECCRV